MDDTLDIDAGAEDQKKRRTAVGPQERNISMAIARTLFNREWRESNPDGKGEDRKAAWKEVRKEQSKRALQLLRALQKQGFVITAPAGDLESDLEDDSEES